MRELRLKMLTTLPPAVGDVTTEASSRVYGVLMDWHLNEHIISVGALSDGNASLYTTSTFGVIGGIYHASVRTAAIAFVRAAELHYGAGAFTTNYVYPSPGQTLFYLLGVDGVCVIDAKTNAVARGRGGLSDLFAAGQRVMTELRIVTEEMDEMQ